MAAAAGAHRAFAGQKARERAAKRLVHLLEEEVEEATEAEEEEEAVEVVEVEEEV